MSDSDQERKERRQQRRRRVQSARTVRANENSDASRYTKLLEERLRAADLLPQDGKPIVAMQTRHVNNYQHAIPFRQQFIEQMVEHFQEIDRQLEVESRKEAEKKDKETARRLRQLEQVYQQKVRELELYNNRDLVRQLLKEHLDESTPQAQLRRITRLEADLRQLRQEHDELVERVNRNKSQCDDNKHEHDERINRIETRFEEYRREIDRYRQKIAEKIVHLQGQLENLNEQQERLSGKQEEHGISIQDLTLQRETLNRLSREIEQIINIRRADLDKLEKLTERLDDIQGLLDQIREGLHPLNRIPFLEQEIEQIRNLLIEPTVIENLQSRLQQIEGISAQHDEQFGFIKGQLNTIESLYQSLKDRIGSIKDHDLQEIQERLGEINQDLQRKTSEINEANTLALRATEQVDDLRRDLDKIKENLSRLDNVMRDITNILSRLNDLEEAKPDDPHIRTARGDSENKLQQLTDLVDELKRRLNELDERKEVNVDDRNEKDLEEYFQRMKREIIEPIVSFMQQLNGQMNDAQTLINDLRTQLNQLLDVQQQKQPPPPPVIQPIVSPKIKFMPYVESLPPIDLLDDIWS